MVLLMIHLGVCHWKRSVFILAGIPPKDLQHLKVHPHTSACPNVKIIMPQFVQIT